jgi:hypothetical protein
MAFIGASERCLQHTAQQGKLVVERAKDQVDIEAKAAALTLLQRLLRGRAIQVSAYCLHFEELFFYSNGLPVSSCVFLRTCRHTHFVSTYAE